jgi:hypothetical protein
MGNRNIDPLIDVLKSRCSQFAGEELPANERAVIVELGTVGLELLRQFLTDVSRCVDALEILAQDRLTP